MNPDGTVMPMKGPAFEDQLSKDFGEDKPGMYVWDINYYIPVEKVFALTFFKQVFSVKSIGYVFRNYTPTIGKQYFLSFFKIKFRSKRACSRRTNLLKQDGIRTLPPGHFPGAFLQKCYTHCIRVLGECL